jgi:hypothetical protein
VTPKRTLKGLITVAPVFGSRISSDFFSACATEAAIPDASKLAANKSRMKSKFRQDRMGVSL